MKLSVIIPVYNEEKKIVNCINSLSKQSLKDIEIIVVDDGSKDDSKYVVQNIKNKLNLENLVLLNQKHFGPGKARNYGGMQATGEILVFVDADMTFDRNFLRKLIDPILKGEVKGTFSKDEYISNWQNPWAQSWNLNEGWQERKRHKSDYPDEQRVFRAILKSEFNRGGGFDENVGYTDDWSLSKRLGYQAVNAEGAIFYHKNPSSLKEVFRQAKWMSKRSYKLGIIGQFIALLRSSLPISLISGIAKSIIHKKYSFIVFKVVYDLGIFIGLIERFTTGKTSR